MRDIFDGVQVFVEVVEAGGFARAAGRLSLTRSAVGKTIARLEERIGVRLFQRTTRTQSLTEEGQQYYEWCLRAIAEMKSGEALIETGRREVMGRLRVSLPVLFGRYCVAPILRAYARQHPRLELELSFSDRQIDLIAEGFDLAVRNGTLGDETSLRARRLGCQRKLLCASPSYLAERGEPLSLESLRDHDLLAYGHGNRAQSWSLADANGELATIQVASRTRSDNLEEIADAAVEGMGLAWLPYWLVSSRLQSGDLTEIWKDRPAAVMECHAVWPASLHLPLRSRLAIDLLAEELPKRLET